MDTKNPVYEAYLEEAVPKDLNFSLKSIRVAVFGFNASIDRYTQIESALDARYTSRSEAVITLMRREKLKAVKSKKRSILRPDFAQNGVLMLPLEAKWPIQSGDEPKSLI
jgi:hypothetical protein